jgi:MFS family permease
MNIFRRYALFRAFHYRNYRLFFFGQGISLIGTWMSIIATSWLVYRLAHQEGRGDVAMVLGLVNFAAQLPVLLFMSFAGVFVDRANRRRILIVTQFISMLQSTALAVLAFSGHAAIWHVILLNFVQGCVNSFDIPARQAFLVEVVENRDDLPNAIALNSSMFNGARLVGPAIAGAIIAAYSESLCFLIDAISYFAVLLALLAMRVNALPLTRPARHFKSELFEGLQYAAHSAPIRSLLVLIALLSVSVVPAQVLMPIFADRLSGPGHGAETLGWLATASGVGALTSAIYLATRKTILGLGKIIVIAASIMGLGLILLGNAEHLTLGLISMLLIGAGMITAVAAGNTIVQTLVDEDKRGRVMSLFGIAFLGSAPFGSLAAGTLSNRFGPGPTMLIAGSLCLASAFVFALKLPGLRRLAYPIYASKGVIQVSGDLRSGTSDFE